MRLERTKKINGTNVMRTFFSGFVDNFVNINRHVENWLTVPDAQFAYMCLIAFDSDLLLLYQHEIER